MASWINRGESVFFQFRNGKSVLNSQCKPRMFKTAEKATLGVNYIDTDDVVEYAEVKHGRWILHDNGSGTCDQCRFTQKNVWDDDNQQNYCGVCGAKMDGGDAE